MSADYYSLYVIAATVDDLESGRISMENRLRSALQEGQDPEAALHLQEVLDRLRSDEALAIKGLEKTMKAHPLGPFVMNTKGLGLKTAARLLGAIGDPYWHSLENRPRTVSELWAYCGYHTVDGQAPRRQKGQKANWSTTAKMRTFLISEGMVKMRASAYRAVYDEARAQYAEKLHAAPCVRCGPSGKPAQPGSPWSAGHQHAAALRRVSKAVLKDLWAASRDARSELNNVAA